MISAAKLLTRYEARRIETNIAKLPDMLRKEPGDRKSGETQKGLSSFAVELGRARGDLGPMEG